MTMTIQELRKKRADAWDEARNFLDSKRTESGVLSDEDSAAYDAMEKNIVALGTEIERLERQERLGKELSAATSTPIVGTPGAHESRKSTASAEYTRAFWDSVRNRNWIDVHNDLQVGTDTEGGYLVPDEFEKKLISALEEENIFRPLATKIQTSSGDRKIPVITQKGEAVWMEEEEAYTLSDDAFGQIALSAYKVGTAIKISEELLNDSVFDLPSYIAKEFARRIGTKEEAFLIGDGIGKPTGIFAATGGAMNGATTAGAAINFDDVMELYFSLKSPYRKKAVWVMNEQTLKALRKVKDSTGNYIWQPSVQVGIPDTILNRPYVTSVYAPTPDAGNKAIAFGDFSYYWIADRQGRSLKRLNELFAMNGQVGFLASQRVDGKLILPEAVKTLTVKGGTTTNTTKG